MPFGVVSGVGQGWVYWIKVVFVKEEGADLGG